MDIDIHPRQHSSRTVYDLDLFDTDTNTDTLIMMPILNDIDTDTLIMMPILNDIDTDTFTTKCQHIL